MVRHLRLLRGLVLCCAVLGSGCAQAAAPPRAPGGQRSPVMTAAGAAGTATQRAVAGGSDVESIVRTVLQNIQANGFDPQANGGLGGLWIDWEFGTDPLVANGGRGGAAHDRLTDLRYLHNLWTWKAEHPADAEFDAEIARYTPIVRQEFGTGTDSRGWVYDEWMDLYRLSGDPYDRQAARNEAAFYFSWYHPETGGFYRQTQRCPAGEYRTEDAVGMAAALVEAGQAFGRSDWTAAGQSGLRFVLQHAYLPSKGVFLHLMGDVVRQDGSANPDETILRRGPCLSDLHNDSHDGGLVRAGAIGAEAMAFLRAYQATGEGSYLSVAERMLDAVSAGGPLGLWDSQHGGYFYGLDFPGRDYAHPGTPRVRANEKEAGRQLQLLTAYHMADVLTGGRYASMEKAMLDVALHDAYYAPGHGYLYAVQPDWTPQARRARVQDFVSTEAMGIALEALQSVETAPDESAQRPAHG